MKTPSPQPHPFRITFHCLAAFLALATPALAVTLNSQEQAIANYLTINPNQGRPELILDPIIEGVAQARAQDMAVRHYFAHVNPDGHAANYLLRQAGYVLPAWWGTDPTANYVESIAAGYSSPSATWNAWMNSPPHKEHLLGQNSFFASETHFGVGYYADPSSQYGYYWVVITAPPQPLIIETPASSETVTTASATISGTAIGAAAIQCQVANSAGTSAWQTLSGTATWTGKVDLAPGKNVVTVESLDSSGTEIAASSRTITYVETATLTVSVSGSGTVTSGFLGTTTRDVSASIVIKATPSRGSLFVGWTGSVSGSNPSISFTMQQQGETIQANFEANPFTRAAGNYAGLLASGTESSVGSFKATLTGSGLVTGRVTLDGKSYAFSGRLTPEGAATITIKRPGLTPLTLSLQCDFSTGQMTGTLTEGTDPLAVSAGLADYNAKTNPFQYAGKYCLVLTAGDEGPRPNGSALLTVTKGGSASLTGTMGGGSRFTCTAAVTSDGLLPVWFVPGGEALGSYVAGYLGFTNNLPSGTLVWYDAPKKNASLFPDGFITELPVTGEPK